MANVPVADANSPMLRRAGRFDREGVNAYLVLALGTRINELASFEFISILFTGFAIAALGCAIHSLPFRYSTRGFQVQSASCKKLLALSTSGLCLDRSRVDSGRTSSGFVVVAGCSSSPIADGAAP